eukprot:403373037
MGTVTKTLLNYIKKADIFGHPINLNYRNQSSFKTQFGGCITLIIQFLLFSYFVVLLINGIFRSEYAITNSSYYRNLSLDTDILYLNRQNFDFAFNLSPMNINGDDEYASLDVDEYFKVEVNQVIMKGDGVKTILYEEIEVPMVLCQGYRFNNQTETLTAMNMIDSYLCPQENFTIAMQGNQVATTAQLLNIRIKSCSQETLTLRSGNKTCKTKQESRNIAHLMLFTFPILQQYFDENDFEVPIKNSISSDYYQLDFNYVHEQHLRVNPNIAYLQDSFISNSYGIQNITYYKTTKEYSLHYVQQDSDPFDIDSHETTFVNFYISLDDQVRKTKRTVETLVGVLSKFGGGISLLFAIGKILVKYLQQKLYYIKLLTNLFYLKEQSQTYQEQKQNSKKQNRKSKIDYKSTSQKSNLDQSENSIRHLVNESSPYQNDTKPQHIQLQNNQLAPKSKDIMSRILSYLYSIKDMRKYLNDYIKMKLVFALCRCWMSKYKLHRFRKQQFIFQNGQLKMRKYLDVQYIIDSLRQLNQLKSIVYAQNENKYAQALMLIDKQNYIELLDHVRLVDL